MSAFTDGFVGYAVTFVGSLTIGRLVPVPPAPFERHLAARMIRMGGRTVLVLSTVAVGIGYLNGSALGITIGALSGWLTAGVGEMCRASGGPRP